MPQLGDLAELPFNGLVQGFDLPLEHFQDLMLGLTTFTEHDMASIKTRKAYGQNASFVRNLFEELLLDGFLLPSLLTRSMSKLLLMRFHTEEAIDRVLGHGAFKGVQHRSSEHSPLRKTLQRVREEQKAVYKKQLADQEAALDALNEKVHECKAAGIHSSEILMKVQVLLSHRETSIAS